MHQVKGLDGIIKSGGAVIGDTGGVGQGTWVDSGNWAILIVDIDGKLSVLGPFTSSMGLLATMPAALTFMTLGRSVSACTAIGPTLLLLGKLQVHLLALHSAKLIGLRGLAATAMRGTLLLK